MTNEHIRTSKGNNDECYTYRYAVEPLLEFLDLFLIKKFAPVEFAKQTLTSPLLSFATCLSCSMQAKTVAALRQKLTIWCPFDTEESEFVKVFKENGYKVVNSHIDFGQDFYTYQPAEFDLIISNPPFTNKTEMFKRLLSFDKPFAILMSILYLNDNQPYKLFKDIDLQLLMFNQRMEFKNQPKEKVINFKSAYFCKNFLPKQIEWRDFSNRNQQKFSIVKK